MTKLSLYQRFDQLFKESYRKNPHSLFCKAVTNISPLAGPFKKAIKDHKHRHSFKKILQTGPMACHPAAATEVHTLVSYPHVFMYLVAIKSFLRFCHNVAVVVHDDGSLSPLDIKLLENHIRGIKVIRKKDADKKIYPMLGNYPNSLKCRQDNVMGLQLFDIVLLSQANKIINLDSDGLFFTEPGEIMEWISDNDPSAIKVLYEYAPMEQKEFLAMFDCPLQPNICVALSCFSKEIFNLELIEGILRQGGSYWQRHWCVNQNIFPILCHAQSGDHKVSFLDADAYGSLYWREHSPVFQHYQISAFLKNYQRHQLEADQVISELKGPK